MPRSVRLVDAAIALTVAATAIVLPSTALAKSTYRTVHTTQTLSFVGSCSFANTLDPTFLGGELDFTPGLRAQSAVTSAALKTNGTCNGPDQSGHLTATLSGQASCALSSPLTGTGSFTPSPEATPIPVKISLTMAYPTGVLTMSGTSSGAATGALAFLQSANLTSILGCFDGQGLSTVSFAAVTVSTGSTPLVSTIPVTRRVKVTVPAKPKAPAKPKGKRAHKQK